MILIVAPYSPVSRSGIAHLGASRKLESIISILSRLDSQLVLVNSAHNDVVPSAISVADAVVGGVKLTEVTLPTLANRSVGKLQNLFCTSHVIEAVSALGRPQLIWLYNGYAFEMLLAIKARTSMRAPMILEFEDWHFSRGRGLNPKPYIDYFFWRIAARFMAGTFAVNDLLANKMRKFKGHVDLLPGIVPAVLVDIATDAPPFPENSKQIHVGFFGGLSEEKGADVVLQLVSMLPKEYVIHVTGTGPLTAQFEVAAKKFPEKLCFYGRVDDATLYRLISRCDVMLNPHSSIDDMHHGIFPFKVIEAVASGRLLVSTAVMQCGLEDVLAGVRFVEHSENAFCEAIVSAKQYYFGNSNRITRGVKAAHKRFGEAALLEKIQGMAQTQNL